MSHILAPCTACGRHVRVAAEPECPFCGVALDAARAARSTPAASERLSRAALFAFATGVAAVGGCASAVDPQHDADAARDTGATGVLYGGPFYHDATAPSDADTGSDVPGGYGAMYGGPPRRDGG